MSTLKYVREHLDDLVMLTKDSFEDHLEKLKVMLTKLLWANFRVNADKSTYYMDTIEYLGYLLTHEGLQTLP